MRLEIGRSRRLLRTRLDGLDDVVFVDDDFDAGDTSLILGLFLLFGVLGLEDVFGTVDDDLDTSPISDDEDANPTSDPTMEDGSSLNGKSDSFSSSSFLTGTTTIIMSSYSSTLIGLSDS
jgi:hypothetical protein